jgi:hypothetical protein
VNRLRDCVDRVHHGCTMNRARCTVGAHWRGAGTVLYLADARRWQVKRGRARYRTRLGPHPGVEGGVMAGRWREVAVVEVAW